MAIEPRTATPTDPLHRLVALVETLVSLAQNHSSPRDSLNAQASYLTRKELAARLGVSARWIERHVVPTAQPRSRGRAFYVMDDVERQLASTGSASSTGRARMALRPRSREARPIEEQLERAISSSARRR